MTRLVARIRILPDRTADSNIDGSYSESKEPGSRGYGARAHMKEPIAFGLQAIIGDFVLNDDEGQMDKLEESIKKWKEWVR